MVSEKKLNHFFYIIETLIAETDIGSDYFPELLLSSFL